MKSETEIRFGFSPCPNDTFMFHALANGLVATPGFHFKPQLMDIEELNRRALASDPLELTKLSLGAYSRVRDRYRMLSVGAALGRGCGPLVVCADERSDLQGLTDLTGDRVAIPGRLTTANLLLRLYGPPGWRPVEMRFDRIAAAVSTGQVDAGLLIHEGRFSYREAGLRCLADLGEVWEQDRGLPLPLGIIAARRNLGEPTCRIIETALRASLQHARQDPDAPQAYVTEHAQELSAEICARHIALYVNDYSYDLGEEGRLAIEEILRR